MQISELKYYPELSSSATDSLLGNIQDKIRIEISLKVLTDARATTENPFTVNYTDGVIQVPGSSWLFDPTNSFTDRFHIGDVCVLGDYVTFDDHGDYTIVEKSSDGLIRVTPAILISSSPVPDDTDYVHLILSNKTPITAAEYRYNFIENSQAVTFDSKIDGSQQLLKIESFDASVTTPVAMAFVGNLNYQIGSATIEGIGITDSFIYQTEFKIKHYTFIYPFALGPQYIDFLNGIKPDYFADLNSLKHVFDVKALYEYTDPNKYEYVIQSEKIGNVGWFNERFNGGSTNYYIDNLVVRRLPSFVVIPNVELTGAQQFVQFIIKNTIDTPFSSGNTKVVLQFCKVPYDASEYDGTGSSAGRNMARNFVFDRVKLTNGAMSTVNGDNYGTNNQVIVEAICAHISSSEVQVSFSIDLVSTNLAIINESEIPTYTISISVQKHTLDTEVADKVNLIVDKSEFYIDNSDPTMIQNDVVFLNHYESDPTIEGSGTFEAFPEDECVAYTKFWIDKNGRESDTILLKSLQLKIKAKNTSTLEEFTLDSFSTAISATDLVAGIQYIDLSLDRPFHIPDTEIRKKIKIKRRSDLDHSNKYYYETYFPFMMRWEYFIPQPDANTDFFNTSQPNNGLNNFWFHYKSGDWKIYYELKIVAKKNETLLAFVQENEITPFDWDSNRLWLPNTIKSYDPDSLVELYDPIAVKKYIYGYKKTLIIALFHWTGGSIDAENYIALFGMESFEGTGINERKRMSTFWASVPSDTMFSSLDGSNKATLDLFDAHTVRVQALVDNEKIPDKPKFKIACRLYDLSEGSIDVGKRMEDGTFKKTESDLQKIKE